MNNVTSIALRSTSLCSRIIPWPRPGRVLRRAFHQIRRELVDDGRLGTSRIVVRPTFESRTTTSIKWIGPPERRSFNKSAILRRLKPYDEEHEEGLSFRDAALNHRELKEVLGLPNLDPTIANRYLKVIHARRVDGTLDVPLDAELSQFYQASPQVEQLALSWLRANYDVDEDAAIIQRFQREEAPREQESPSALIERGQRLGLFKTQDRSQKEDPAYYGPQSGQYYASLSEKQNDVYGRSELERIRTENEARAEEEERQLQEEIDKSMEVAQAKEQERSQALAERPEQSLEVSDGAAKVRPPNEFEKWVIRARRRATSNLTLDSPEVVKLSRAQKILPSLLFVLLAGAAIYVSANYWEPPRRADRMFPDLSLSVATCGGLLAANVFVFLLWRFPPALSILNKYFIVVPAWPHALSMLGNTFSHIQFRHLAMNMLSLFIFGPSLHEDIGRASFMAIYLAAGLFGSVVSLSMFVLRGIQITSSMGASGSMWGITAAYLWLHKDDTFSFIFIPREWQESALAKGWMLLLVLVLFDISSAVRKAGIDIAAHMGGLVVGVLGSAIWRKQHGDVTGRNKPGFLSGLLDEANKRSQK